MTEKGKMEKKDVQLPLILSNEFLPALPKTDYLYRWQLTQWPSSIS
jgi:hypothetical protein